MNILKIFKKKRKKEKSTKIIGVTLGWDGLPALMREDGTILPRSIERIIYKEYYKKDSDWPIDPITGEKMPISE